MSSFIGKYVIVRTYSAGVFAGYLVSLDVNGKNAELREARRLWSWSGAASLSQLAQDGTSAPELCKFPVAVDRMMLTEVIEIDLVTDRAKRSIASVPVWSE